jgi:arginase
MSSSALGVIGVPTSAAAFAPGQEKAPQALREAGLLECLGRQGVSVHDRGDRTMWRWRPDREHRWAQNADKIIEIVQDTARRVIAAAEEGEVTLVLGGDCTVGIGTVAGHVRAAERAGERVGLIYFDTHADLNVPGHVSEGALDWMGLAHMLGEPGTIPELVSAGHRVPLLEPDQVLLFGWGAEQATGHEREAIQRLGLSAVPVDVVADDPEGAAARAVERMEGRFGRLLVHFDVDVIDFTDVPLSENWGRNEGLAYATALRALTVLLGTRRLAGLTITELNPDHTEEGANTLGRFSGDLAQALAGSLS